VANQPKSATLVFVAGVSRNSFASFAKVFAARARFKTSPPWRDSASAIQFRMLLEILINLRVGAVIFSFNASCALLLGQHPACSSFTVVRPSVVYRTRQRWRVVRRSILSELLLNLLQLLSESRRWRARVFRLSVSQELVPLRLVSGLLEKVVDFLF